MVLKTRLVKSIFYAVNCTKNKKFMQSIAQNKQKDYICTV